jgi:hypothetical protein
LVLGFAAPVKILIRGEVNFSAIVPAKVAKPPLILKSSGAEVTRGAVATSGAVFNGWVSHCFQFK